MPIKKITIGDGITTREKTVVIECPGESDGALAADMLKNAATFDGGRTLWREALDLATSLNDGVPPGQRDTTRPVDGAPQTRRWFAEEIAFWVAELKREMETGAVQFAVIAAGETARLMAEARLKFAWEVSALTGKKFWDSSRSGARQRKAETDPKRAERAALFVLFLEQGYSRMTAARKAAGRLGCSVRTVQRAVKQNPR